jgi:hypothetical protein
MRLRRHAPDALELPLLVTAKVKEEYRTRTRVSDFVLRMHREYQLVAEYTWNAASIASVQARRERLGQPPIVEALPSEHPQFIV